MSRDRLNSLGMERVLLIISIIPKGISTNGEKQNPRHQRNKADQILMTNVSTMPIETKRETADGCVICTLVGEFKDYSLVRI